MCAKSLHVIAFKSIVSRLNTKKRPTFIEVRQIADLECCSANPAPLTIKTSAIFKKTSRDEGVTAAAAGFLGGAFELPWSLRAARISSNAASVGKWLVCQSADG